MHSALLTVAHSQNDEQRARAGRGRGIRRSCPGSAGSGSGSAGIGSEWLPRRFLHVSHHLPVCICFVVFDCRLDFHVPFLCTRSYTRSLLLLLLVVVSDSNRKQHRLHVYTSSSTRGRKSDESRDTARCDGKRDQKERPESCRRLRMGVEWRGQRPSGSCAACRCSASMGIWRRQRLACVLASRAGLARSLEERSLEERVKMKGRTREPAGEPAGTARQATTQPTTGGSGSLAPGKRASQAS